jgi:hypothetical protein
MIVKVTPHPDGVVIISYRAENEIDKEANKLLIDRYDNVPVIGDESILGSWSGDGSSLDIKVFPLTQEEVARNERADQMIAGLNRVGRRVNEDPVRLIGQQKLLT